MIDISHFSARALGQHVLYADSLVLVCRQNHPALSEPLTIENLRNYDHSSFITEGQALNSLRQRIDEIFPERQISFSSYNMFTTASLIGSSDMLCIMPSRLYHLLRKCWPLEEIPLSQLNAESIEISLHYNKLSLRDPVLENVINIICRFLTGWRSTSPCHMQGKRHKTTTILQIGDLAGCFIDRFNDILPVVRSKIVDKYNIPLN